MDMRIRIRGGEEEEFPERIRWAWMKWKDLLLSWPSCPSDIFCPPLQSLSSFRNILPIMRKITLCFMMLLLTVRASELQHIPWSSWYQIIYGVWLLPFFPITRHEWGSKRKVETGRKPDLQNDDQITRMRERERGSENRTTSAAADVVTHDVDDDALGYSESQTVIRKREREKKISFGWEKSVVSEILFLFKSIAASSSSSTSMEMQRLH